MRVLNLWFLLSFDANNLNNGFSKNPDHVMLWNTQNYDMSPVN